ncbi:MAG: hypothetical protein KKE73_11610 [Proteobacteria bacterium]|nr:hypothetical protein [Pseudomonadota bacterium]
MQFVQAPSITPPLADTAISAMTSPYVIVASTHIGTILALAGLIFSFLAYRQAKRAKKAAAEAKSAVYSIDSISGLSHAATSIAEAQNHMRSGNLSILPDKFLSAIKHVSSTRNSCPGLEENEKEDLLQVTTQLRNAKNAIEVSLEKNKKLNEVARLNKILTDQIESLQAILGAVKRRQK